MTNERPLTISSIRKLLSLLLVSVVVSGCSGAGDSQPSTESATPSAGENLAVNPDTGTDQNMEQGLTNTAAGELDNGASVIETEVTSEDAQNESNNSTGAPSDSEIVTDPLPDEAAEAALLVPPNLELIADKTFRFSWEGRAAAEFYRLFEDPDGMSGYSQISEDIDPSTLSYDHRVALYSRVNASYLLQTCNTDGCIDSEETFVSGTLDEAVGFFKASNTEGGFLFTSPELATFDGDRFGTAMSISADGNTLAVGAHWEDSAATGINGDQSDNSKERAGAVYVFQRAEGRWQQSAYVKASNSDAGDRFGGEVQLSADGNTLAVGADGEASIASGINGDQSDNSARNGSGNGAGAVYVFVRANGNGNWQQQAYVKPDAANDTDNIALFGSGIGLSEDGKTMAVGAPGEDGGAGSDNGDQSNTTESIAGAVYVFTRNGEVWLQEAYLTASNSSQSGGFGDDVSISADGNTLAVGAAFEDGISTGVNGDQANDFSFRDSGAVYVFERTNDTWQQQAYVKASNTEEGDFFGWTVSLSGEGNTLAVGAIEENSSASGINGNQFDSSGLSSASSGAVYVFERSNNNWSQQAYVKASNSEAFEQFGWAISLSRDGNVLAVSGRGDSSNSNGINGDQLDETEPAIGAAYVFTRSGGNWQQKAYVKATNNDKESENISVQFGQSLSLSADGNTLAVAADEEASGATGINGEQSDDSAHGSGAVFLY